MRSVIFICTANRCRSPMAVGLFARQVAHLNDGREWQISSAGTWAIDDQPATALARIVMGQQGIDLDQHRSRPLNGTMLRAADVILVMTRHHLEAIQAEFPEVANRTFLLSQLIGQTFDIDDPFEGTEEDYRRCADGIERILKEGYARLVELAERPSISHEGTR
jgi:protein-tyrosine-phosphatase